MTDGIDSGASGQSIVGQPGFNTPTPDSPQWLAVVGYTKQDIDKAANSNDFLSARLRFWDSETNRYRVADVALLRYEQDYRPAKYQLVYDAPTGSATRRNPNSFDLYTTVYMRSLLPHAKDDFRTWWEGLQDPVEDDDDAAHPSGRAELLRQMSREGIIACIENDDIPAALELIENTKNINHVNWGVYRDQLVPLLEARLVNHWHLMSPKQQAKHTKYVPPKGTDTTNSGTNSGTTL